MNMIINKDCIEGMKEMSDQSVNCCVTSPPYFGLRDYGHDGQIGLEETPDLFVQKMVEVFREVKRVLKDDGTLWLNLGDSYASYKDGKATPDSARKESKGTLVSKGMAKNRSASTFHGTSVKNKDLIGIPWRVAFALQADGWYLRQDIIWHKPNPMPESVTDRCTKSHEYIFLLSKSPKYYYDQDAIKQPILESSKQRLSQDIENQKGFDRIPGKTNGTMKAVGTKFGGNKYGDNYSKKHRTMSGNVWTGDESDGANKRSVWTVTTKPFKEAHFATFPPDLIQPCILAGCPEDGIVLDPFMGAGTTALVARKLNRYYIGFELNMDYINIAQKRLRKELGLFF
jgi:DNA modification methylase